MKSGRLGLRALRRIGVVTRASGASGNYGSSARVSLALNDAGTTSNTMLAGGAIVAAAP
jgi:hypothetical protein